MSDNRLSRVATSIDAMSLRERAMLGSIALLVVWALWQTLLMAPLNSQRKDLSQRLQTASLTVGALNQSIQTLAAQRSRDPLAEQRLKLEQLQKQKASLDATLTEATSGLIDPRQMGAVLESVLAKQSNITLASLSSLPTEPMVLDTSATESKAPSLYRHGMRITVEGRYNDLLEFLNTLDALPWDFIWSDLELTVDEQQRSHLSITVKTLSVSAGWLGV